MKSNTTKQGKQYQEEERNIKLAHTQEEEHQIDNLHTPTVRRRHTRGGLYCQEKEYTARRRRGTQGGIYLQEKDTVLIGGGIHKEAYIVKRRNTLSRGGIHYQEKGYTRRQTLPRGGIHYQEEAYNDKGKTPSSRDGRPSRSPRMAPTRYAKATRIGRTRNCQEAARCYGLSDEQKRDRASASSSLSQLRSGNRR